MLSNTFTPRPAADADVPALAEFNSRIFRPSVGVWTRDLLSGAHPAVRPSDALLMEQASDARLAASVVTIRQRWTYRECPLDVAQLELVGCAPEARGLGLIRAAIEHFERSAAAGGAHVAAVHGTPALYQRLGYHFAVEQKGGVLLSLSAIPEPRAGMGFIVRGFRERDWDRVAALRARAYRDVAIQSELTESIWRYQEGQSPDSEHACETCVLEQGDGVAGYMRLRRRLRGDSLTVSELAPASYDAALALLRAAAERARAASVSRVLLQVPEVSDAYAIGAALGGQPVPPFAWQVKVLDWRRFFEAIAPALQRRVAGSLLAGTDFNCSIGLPPAHAAATLSFSGGILTDVREAAGHRRADIAGSAGVVIALVFGLRSRAMLEAVHLEFQTQPERRYIIDTLFPRERGFVSDPY